MLREPWESEKAVLTGNLVSPVGRSLGCSVFSASCWNSSYLQLVNLSAERQSCTCMCNYNTEICGMAMAQAVVPVYTIPNTYRVQQSLWEGICRIIPGIAHTSESELRAFEHAVPRNTPVEQAITVPAASNSAVSSSTCKKNAAQQACQTKIPLKIPLARSVWVPKEVFRHIPTVNLMDNRDPPGTRPQKTSTPIKTTPAADRSHSRKKLDISKIKGAHLLFEMQD